MARYGGPALIALALVMLLITWTNVGRAGFLVQIVGIVGSVPLAVVAYRPLIAWRIAWVAAAFASLAPSPSERAWPWQPGPIMVFLAVLVAVASSQRPPVIIGVGLATAALAVAQANPNNGPGIVIFITLLMAATDQLRRRRSAQRELAEQAERSAELEERSAVLEERGAVLAERTRIARELHDVVAHHMSMIAVRAETAPYRLDGLPAPARNEFGQISAAAREALTEMRRLLGVLRSERDEPPVAPQPGLTDLPELVDGRRRAGERVTLTLPDELADLPPAVDLAAYRIVQEALSNAARHAPGAPTTVVVSRDPVARSLVVAVRNAAPTPGSAPAAAQQLTSRGGPGHGLVGMRERVSMLGGELSAGPEQGGGFAVRAVLPLGEPSGDRPGQAVTGR